MLPDSTITHLATPQAISSPSLFPSYYPPPPLPSISVARKPGDLESLSSRWRRGRYSKWRERKRERAGGRCIVETERGGEEGSVMVARLPVLPSRNQAIFCVVPRFWTRETFLELRRVPSERNDNEKIEKKKHTLCLEVSAQLH